MYHHLWHLQSHPRKKLWTFLIFAMSGSSSSSSSSASFLIIIMMIKMILIMMTVIINNHGVDDESSSWGEKILYTVFVWSQHENIISGQISCEKRTQFFLKPTKHPTFAPNFSSSSRFIKHLVFSYIWQKSSKESLINCQFGIAT